MSEVEKVDRILTPEQQAVFDEVQAAIPAGCNGCSTALFMPEKIAMAVTTPRRIGAVKGVICLSMEGARSLIEKQRKCVGRCPVSKYCRLGWVPPEE